jgi:HEAT repeat protein
MHFPSQETFIMKVLLPHPRIDGPAWWLIAAGLALVILLLVGLSALSAAPMPGAGGLTVDRLIRQLGDETFNKREEAGKRLGEVGLPAVQPLRAAATKDADPEVRHRARRLLKSFNMQDLINRFAEDLGRADPEQRESARSTLATLSGPNLESLRQAVAACKDPESRRRAEAMMEGVRPASVEMLIRQLGDNAFAKREDAFDALEGLGKPALPGLRKAVADGIDPEIVSRARRLIQEIEKQKLD